MTAATPYPWSGPSHSSCLRASCLAVAEERVNNTHGAKWGLFMERLKASVDRDRLNSPSFLGMNLDPGSRGLFKGEGYPLGFGEYELWNGLQAVSYHAGATYNGV